MCMARYTTKYDRWATANRITSNMREDDVVAVASPHVSCLFCLTANLLETGITKGERVTEEQVKVASRMMDNKLAILNDELKEMERRLIDKGIRIVHKEFELNDMLVLTPGSHAHIPWVSPEEDVK